MMVLVYELGYVQYWYGLWMLLCVGVVSIVMLVIVGDFLLLFVVVLVLLVINVYLCDNECEVDFYGCMLVWVGGVDILCMVVFFECVVEWCKVVGESSLLVIVFFMYFVDEEWVKFFSEC